MSAEFERLVAEHRRELLAHCYRMTGSVQDAEDALQDALVGAWRGLAGFEGRSSVRTWLYRIATHACLRLVERRPPRVLRAGPAYEQTAHLGDVVPGPVWLEPWVDGPEDTYERRESVELAYAAALQHLPGTQRAVLILREVLRFPAAEVAGMLEMSVPAVNSALQRARASVGTRRSQQAELAALGDDGRRLVAGFAAAFERADVPALLAMLTEDATFSMPPLPAWFAGPEWIGRFWTERMFATGWRLVPVRAAGAPAFGCYQGPAYRLGSVLVLALRAGRIAELTGFLDPAVHARFGLPEVFRPGPMSSAARPALPLT